MQTQGLPLATGAMQAQARTVGIQGHSADIKQRETAIAQAYAQRPQAVKEEKAAGDFTEYGRNVSATLWQNERPLGGMAKVVLKSNKDNRPYEFNGQVVSDTAQ